MGPFYCPRDQKVYIDLSFFEDLKNRFRAPGDFAQAYVIAHKIGHHVQNLLGIADKVDTLRSRVGENQGNRLSVLLELQADCLAGVWAYHADRSRRILEQGDIEEALNAASAIGDDRLQRRTRVTSCPSRSPMAAPRKGYTGSGRESKRGIPGDATPSPPNVFNQGAGLSG